MDHCMNHRETIVVLVTYNRPHHTSRVLDGIRSQGIRELTIFMDAPATDKDKAAQDELMELYGKIEWAQITLRRRPRNTGLAHSIVESVTNGLETHESVILLEDDCVPRPGFFEFMERGLQHYAGNPKVRSLCGYQFPFIENYDENAVTAVPLHRFTPWGWATWRDRWRDYTSTTLAKLVEGIASSGRLSTMGADLQRYCTSEYYLDGKADIWSLNWVLTHYLTDTYAVFPSRSLIENIGFDGTGVHSVETDAFVVHEQRAQSETPINFPAEPKVDAKAAAALDNYLDEHSKKMMVKQLPKLV
jgi:hypothetical protein